MRSPNKSFLPTENKFYLLPLNFSSINYCYFSFLTCRVVGYINNFRQSAAQKVLLGDSGNGAPHDLYHEMCLNWSLNPSEKEAWM